MRVQIETPSRLHLGLLDLNGNLGRVYGSIGIAISRPVILLEGIPSDKLEVRGGNENILLSLIEKFSEKEGIDVRVEIELKEMIPQHVGLGSGTQLSLAIASCISQIYGLDLSVVEMATIMERGKISGIGTACFEYGGFIIDGGHKLDRYRGPPPVIFRRPFPKDWRFVIAIPETKVKIHGNREERALKRVFSSCHETSAEICRIVQMEMLPSLIEEDIENFGRSLMEIDKRVGGYFKDVQNDIYKEKICRNIIESMLEYGAYGAGQSSWGPTLYAIVEDSNANNVEKGVRRFFSENDIKGMIFSVHANNNGARIELIDD